MDASERGYITGRITAVKLMKQWNVLFAVSVVHWKLFVPKTNEGYCSFQPKNFDYTVNQNNVSTNIITDLCFISFWENNC